ncbi:MAG: alkaline phosphatase family protein [Myxococcales bacterium]
MPIEGDPAANPVVHVMLAVDSLAYSAVVDAQSRGAFPGFKLARHVTGFPGSSDISWTRILHTAPIESYELQYYDPIEHQVVNGGYSGLLLHAVPFGTRPCYQAFDFSANGLTNALYNYGSPRYSLGTTLDNVFTLLDGRAQTRSTEAFLAFINEIDAIGHMDPYGDYLEAVLVLDRRIEAFKAAHPERTWLFTLVSDHGHNFIPSPDDKMIRFHDELPRMGIEAVESLAGRDADGPLAAVPIVHARVTYVALHTVQEQAPEIARRVSGARFTDLAIAKLPAPEGRAEPWYGIWRDGELALWFGHDAQTDSYFVDLSGKLDPLGLGWMGSGNRIAAFTDQELFERTRYSDFPDLLYRTRTALEPIGLEHAAQVLVSFRHPYASVGFEVPGGGNSIAIASFHGGMHRLDTNGVVLTEARDLPPAIRSDTFLELFPIFAKRIAERGMLRAKADANESLDYSSMP